MCVKNLSVICCGEIPVYCKKIVYLKILLLTVQLQLKYIEHSIGETCTCTNTCRNKNGGCCQCIIIISKLQYLYKMRGCTGTASSSTQLNWSCSSANMSETGVSLCSSFTSHSRPTYDPLCRYIHTIISQHLHIKLYSALHV